MNKKLNFIIYCTGCTKNLEFENLEYSNIDGSIIVICKSDKTHLIEINNDGRFVFKNIRTGDKDSSELMIEHEKGYEAYSFVSTIGNGRDWWHCSIVK